MSGDELRLTKIRNYIGACQDFPKPGILFRDVFPLMRQPAVFADCIALMCEHIEKHHSNVDIIVGLDARGFIFGPLIAQKLQKGFVPIRKAGKLPGETVSASYTLEYGSDTFEVQKAALTAGQNVIIVDDLLATGGTLQAACKLMSELQVDVLECMVLIELTDLNGRSKVGKDVPVHAFIGYSGE